MKRLTCLIGAAVACLVAAAPSMAATQLLPDLGMARLSTIKIDKTTMPGHKLLRYTAIMANVGAGRFEIVGTRSSTSTSTMSVVQKIYNSDGTVTTTPVNTDMFWLAHDSRWHVRDIEAGTLRRLDNGVKVGTLTKHAYCLADDSSYRLSLPGAPQSAHFTDAGCDPNQPNALRADMGISVGWADDYFASTYQQYIDITGLPNGKYVLTATANPGDVVKESNYSNDSVTATIQIGDSTATILSTSPGV